jgi:hypothetical protein
MDEERTVTAIEDGACCWNCGAGFYGPHGYPVMCWPCHRTAAPAIRRHIKRAIHLEAEKFEYVPEIENPSAYLVR